MADFDRTYDGLRGATDRSVAYDMGLRTHMIRMYNYMAGGVALTGVVAWLTYQMAVVTDAGGRIIGLTGAQEPCFGIAGGSPEDSSCSSSHRTPPIHMSALGCACAG